MPDGAQTAGNPQNSRIAAERIPETVFLFPCFCLCGKNRICFIRQDGAKKGNAVTQSQQIACTDTNQTARNSDFCPDGAPG